MATIPAESSSIDPSFPPLGWHPSHRHTQWQVYPLGHLFKTDQPSSVQTKPLRQAAQLVGLPAELGDGSGFSNFTDGIDATSPLFSELQQTSLTPQPDIQPLRQESSESSFQIEQSAASPKDSDVSDTISEKTISLTIERLAENQAEDISANTLPAISPLQRQPLGQHQPLGFNQPVITEPPADIAPPIHPRSAATSTEPESSIAQQSQTPSNVTVSIAPEAALTSDHINRAEISAADAVEDAPIGTETVDNPTPIQRSPSLPSSEVELADNQQAALLSDNNAPLDPEPTQESSSIADALTTDITEIVDPIQRSPAVSPDIETSTDRLDSQITDVTPIEVNPKSSSLPDTDEIVPASPPIETTDVTPNVGPDVTQQSQSSLQRSSAEQSDPDIESPELSPPIQPVSEELPAVIQPALGELQSFSESPKLEPGSVTPAADGPNALQRRSESTANDGVDVVQSVQSRAEQFSDAQPAPDQSEDLYQPAVELPLSDNDSAPVDTPQGMPEISAQEVPPKNRPNDISTAKLTDVQAQHLALPETSPPSSEPTETFQPLESPDLSQESKISELSAPETQLPHHVAPPEQTIQQKQVEALPTSPEQPFLEARVDPEQISPPFPVEGAQNISPDETLSSQNEANLQAQLQQSPAPSTQSDDSASRGESESADRQEVSPQVSAPADLPPIQAKLLSAPAIQPLGMHELLVDAFKESPNPLPETVSADITDLPAIQKTQSQVQETGLLSPKLAALSSKYGLDEPDDSFWSPASLTSGRENALQGLETPAAETDDIEAHEPQMQTVSLSVPDTTVELAEEGSAHGSSGEEEDRILWQLAYILYGELRNDRGGQSQLTSSNFQRASPSLIPIQSEQNKITHLPLALWPPPMHQLATHVRLQLQNRLRQNFERSARLSRFI
ncbi:MAG: hypothetical protein AAF821_12790 [Cyanobacteria bacterium P01_D01_bin.156]